MKIIQIRRLFTICLLILFTITTFGGCTAYKKIFTMGLIKTNNGHPSVDLAAAKQIGTYDCGVVCVSLVLNYWGDSVTQEKIIQSLGKPPKDGFTLKDLQGYIQRRGFQGLVFSGNLSDLSYHNNLGRPCIVVYRETFGSNHCIVIYNSKKVDGRVSELEVIDPKNGEIEWVDAIQFDRRWDKIGRPILLISP
jgi:ABC-type bacteriocin/lantibiotic exporter with double-glycine peptidase domain